MQDSSNEATNMVAPCLRIYEQSMSVDSTSTTSGAYSDESSGVYSDESRAISTQVSIEETAATLNSDYNLARADLLESEAQCEALRQRLTDFEIKNFMQISKSPEFLDFCPDHLQRLVEHNDLNVSSEADVFWAIRRWYREDVPLRQQHLPKLISCLRLTQFDVDFLYSHINTLPGCEVFVNKAVEWLLRPTVRSTTTLRFPKPRKVLQTDTEKSWITVQTRGDHRFADKCVLRYNRAQCEWQKLAEIKLERSNFGIAQLENSIICIGGLGRNNKPSNRVNCYNLSSHTWEPMPSMEQRRVYLSVALLDGRIYAFGGQDEKYQALNSVEMFDTIAGRWQTISSMPTRRAGTGAAVLDGKLYVIGGFNKAHLNIVERYDPRTNIWTQCVDMNEPRGWPGVTVHNEQIYSIGGWYNSALRTVERYCASSNKWTMMSALNVARGSVCAVSMNDELWAFGGYSEGMLKDVVEVYDAENDKWMEKKKLPEAGRYVC